MLTADLIRPRMRRRGSELRIQHLPETAAWRATAADLIALLGTCVGQPQRAWHEAVEAYAGVRTDYIVLRGLAKVLEDGATFEPIVTRVDPLALRAHLFARGPAFAQPDLFSPARDAVIEAAAAEFDLTADEAEAALFADYPPEYRMTDAGAAWTPEGLIARYNLELARGALYWCSGMAVEIFDNYQTFWRYLKLFKLMFWASPLPDGGYRVDIDGPLSPFVSATTRYGRQMAAFLPALLLGDRWTLRADVQPPWQPEPLIYELDPSSELRSHFRRRGAFDSRLEADFAAEFEARFGGERGAWTLARESEVILLGDTVMIPDFSVTHRQDGRRALIEIVGCWHPDYLRRKVAKLRAAGRSDLIVLVYERVNLSAEKLADVPGEVLYFASKPVLKAVMAAVEKSAVAPAHRQQERENDMSPDHASSDSDLPAKLAAPARRALAGAGWLTLEQVAQHSEAELLALHGMGPKAIRQLREALAEKGLSLAPPKGE